MNIVSCVVDDEYFCSGCGEQIKKSATKIECEGKDLGFYCDHERVGCYLRKIDELLNKRIYNFRPTLKIIWHESVQYKK